MKQNNFKKVVTAVTSAQCKNRELLLWDAVKEFQCNFHNKFVVGQTWLLAMDLNCHLVSAVCCSTVERHGADFWPCIKQGLNSAKYPRQLILHIGSGNPALTQEESKRYRELLRSLFNDRLHLADYVVLGSKRCDPTGRGYASFFNDVWFPACYIRRGCVTAGASGEA